MSVTAVRGYEGTHEKGDLGVRKRAWLAAALVILSVVLSACGAAREGERAPDTFGVTEPDSTPLKVGVILTTSGPVGAVGVKQLTGLEMAIAEINEAGGILGRQVELLVRDDGGDPTKARIAAQELVEKEGVAVIVGTTVSSTALAIAPYLTEQQVAMIGSFSALELNDPEKYPYAFTGTALSNDQAAVIVGYALDVLKAGKVGIIAESGAYGKAMTDDFMAQLQARGVEPATVETYPQGSIDMAAQLNNLRRAEVDVILGATLGTDSVRILKGIQSMGWRVPYLGNSDLGTRSVVEGVGPEGMELVYSFYQKRHSFSADADPHPKAVEFAEKFVKWADLSELDQDIQHQSLFYDLAYITKQAIEDAASLSGPDIAVALEQMRDFDGAHATFTFTAEDHGGLDYDDLTMVRSASFRGGFYEAAPGQ